MIIYRLCKARYQNDLTGEGARLYGGRWNNPGIALLYTSESRALCMLEAIVHIPIGLMPQDYVLMTLEVPDIFPFLEPDLPINWNELPPPAVARQIGDEFVNAGEFLVMKIPSAVVEGDYNYLLNPNHSEFHRVRVINVEPFDLDQRLFTR